MTGTRIHNVTEFGRRFTTFMDLEPGDRMLAIKKNGLAKQAISMMCPRGKNLWESFVNRSDRTTFPSHYGGFTPCDRCKSAFKLCLSELFP